MKPVWQPTDEPTIDPCGPGAVQVFIPLCLKSEANRRDHWAVKRKRTSGHREAVALMLNRFQVPPLPLLVTLTRYGPKRFDDDNNTRSMKSIRDETARFCGVDDGDDYIKFICEQRACCQYGVLIRIETMDCHFYSTEEVPWSVWTEGMIAFLNDQGAKENSA
jgi:hypothetical protein